MLIRKAHKGKNDEQADQLVKKLRKILLDKYPDKDEEWVTLELRNMIGKKYDNYLKKQNKKFTSEENIINKLKINKPPLKKYEFSNYNIDNSKYLNNLHQMKNSLQSLSYKFPSSTKLNSHKGSQIKERKAITSQEISSKKLENLNGSMDEIFGEDNFKFTDIKKEMEKEQKILKRNLQDSLNKLKKKSSQSALKKNPSKHKPKIKQNVKDKPIISKNKKKNSYKAKKNKKDEFKYIPPSPPITSIANSPMTEWDNNLEVELVNFDKSLNMKDNKDGASFLDKLDIPRMKIVSLKNNSFLCKECLKSIQKINENQNTTKKDLTQHGSNLLIFSSFACL